MTIAVVAALGVFLSAALPATAATLSFGWANTWGGSGGNIGEEDFIGATAVDGTGHVYVTGAFFGAVDFDPGSGVDTRTSNGGQDVFLSKFGANGNLLWTLTWGGSNNERGNGVAVDGSGNVYVVGCFQGTVDFNPGSSGTDNHASNAGTFNNIYVSKFDAGGIFQWARTWGGTTGGEGYSVAVDGAGNAYVAGDFSSGVGTNVDFDPSDGFDWHTFNGFFDSFLSKFDASGKFVWAKTWGGEGYDDGPAVAVDGTSVYVTGMYASQNIDFNPDPGVVEPNHPASNTGSCVDVFLSKFNTTGVFQWVRTWGAQDVWDVAQSVRVDGAGNVVVAGYFSMPPMGTGLHFAKTVDFDPGSGVDNHTSHGDSDAFLSKLTANGGFLWARTWGGSGDNDQSSAMRMDGANNAYVLGRFTTTVDFDPSSGGTDNHTSNGGTDAFLSHFDASGNFVWATTWGGSGDDGAFTAALDGTGNAYVAGTFVGAVDFNPESGVDTHTSPPANRTDVFLSKFLGSASYLLWTK